MHRRRSPARTPRPTPCVALRDAVADYRRHPRRAAPRPWRSTPPRPAARDRQVILPLILLLVLVALARAAALGRRAGACSSRRWSRPTSPASACRGGSSPRCSASSARRRGAAAGVPLPRGARRRLQHLPGHPGRRGGPRARRQRRACCARSPRPAASSPAPASCWPRCSRCSACCRWWCSPSSASSSASACCSTPSSCAPCWCRPSRSSSATASGGRAGWARADRPAVADDVEGTPVGVGAR